MNLRRKRGAARLDALLAAAFCAALLVWAVWPRLPRLGAARAPRTIVFYGFSILGETMNEAIFPAFEKSWRARPGEAIEGVGSFAGSGTVANQIILGAPAQLALLSLESDAERLAAAGVVPEASWHSLPHQGVVNRTPFFILVRPGNPKNIRGFSDLARPGIGLVHPDPLTSGGGNWAILAEYGAGQRVAGRASDGERLLAGIWKNVVAQASSARAARAQFENGFGDALVTYEQEALFDASRGRLRAEIVVPGSTVLSEHTLVVIDRNVAEADRPAVTALARFLWSDEAQRLFAVRGFRSVDERFNEERPFPTIRDPFFVSDFGGWAHARRDILDGVWKNRVLKAIQP
ncbi:MAG: substrate-binding domain-containing protein [Thermoanaerobaculia bacterium]